MRIPTRAVYRCCLLLNLGFVQQSHQDVQPSDEGIYVSAPYISAPQPIYTPQPEYPSSLRSLKHRIEGTCVLQVKVDGQGGVSEIHVTHSLDKRLDQSAIDTVKRWKFKPAMREGKPVTVLTSVEVDFRLD